MDRKNISSVEGFCYGCGVCQTFCPPNVIKLTTDKDGFIKPYIYNLKGCIHCGLCMDICAYNNRNKFEFSNPKRAIAAWSNNKDCRNFASSGGIVPVILQSYLEKGYIIYCVEYDQASNKLNYYIPSSVSDLNRGMKSKYLQAIFPEKIDYTKNNVIVGTPCAIASIRAVLKKKKSAGDNILIDFFCHGTPSYLLWNKYLEHVGINRPTNVVWRDKENGWHDSWRMIVEDNNKIFSKYFSQGDLFYKFFLRNRCLRNSCYNDCVFKSTNSTADIRVGDLWGTKFKEDKEGVSGVLIFNDKGLKVIDEIRKDCTVIDESIAIVTESQMKSCAKKPSSYKFVKEALSSEKSLDSIDRTASIIELFIDIIPSKTRYYCSRILSKLLGK